MASASASSSSPRPSTPATPKPDSRTKAPTACDHCRQRKLRCDGNADACSNCSLYQTTCIYAKGRNKSGPPKGSKRKKANPDDPPTARQRRRTSASPAAQMPTPPCSEGSMSAKLPARDISPVSDTSSQYIPTLMGPIPISSEWLSELSSIDTATSQFSPQYSGPLTYSFNDDPLMMDPLLLSTLFPDPITPLADSMSSHYGQTSFPPPTEASASTSASQFTPAFPNPPSSFSNTAGVFAVLDYPSPTSLQQPFSPPSPAASSPLAPSEYSALLAAHAFVPLFPFARLHAHIASSQVRKGSSLHAAFFLSALDALTAVTSISSSAFGTDSSTAYLSAQNQAMPAYFAALSSTSASASASDADDSALTAAALLYLTARSVFSAMAKEAATWLRLAREIVDSPCFPPTHRRWFMRISWLWGRGVVALGGLPSSKLENADLTHDMAAPKEGMDEYQCEFDGLVALVLDLDVLLARTNELAAAAAAPGAGLERLADGQPVPLCVRVNEWIKGSPLAREALLRFVDGSSADAGIAERACVREGIARVLHLVYYGFAIRFDQQDRMRCRMRRTSLYVAVTRIVDAADWLVSAQYMWLWAFAEPALLLARDFLLDRCGASAAPSPGEVTLLSLIHDVLEEAADALGAATAQRVRQEADALARVLRAPGRSREGVSKGDILGGIRELLAQGIAMH